MTHFPIMVAQQRRIFEQEGLSVEAIVIRPDLAVRGIVSGDLAYAAYGSSVLQAALRGFPVRVIMVYATRPLFSLMSNAEIQSIKDLRGKVMGVNSLVGGDFWAAKTLLRQAGIDAEQEMTIRVIGGTAQRMLALRSGLVHATTLSVPSDLLAEKKEGLRRLAFAGDSVEDFSSGIGVSTRFLKERPDQIKKLAKAIFKAMAYAKAHRRESVELVMSKWNLDGDTATEAFNMVAKTWADNGVPPDAFLLGAMRQAQGQKPVPPLSEVADLTLARDAFKESQKK